MIRSPFLTFIVLGIVCHATNLGAQTIARPPGADTSDVSDRPIGAAEGGFQMSKSPSTALLWSIIPGGGQVYTEQYWKVPLFVVPFGGLGWGAVANHLKFRDYADSVRVAEATGATNVTTLRARRESYRDNRDQLAAIALGVYLLAFIDAYVGAHLYDFDVEEDLSGFYLVTGSDRVGIGVRF